jgi:hypothetical protein
MTTLKRGTQIEYKIIVIGNWMSPTERLNKLGESGWEAYAAIPRRGSNSIVHFLKRPVEREDDNGS